MSFLGSIFGGKRQHELEMARVELRKQRADDRAISKMTAYENGVQPSNGFASVMANSAWIGTAASSALNPGGSAFASLFGGGGGGPAGARPPANQNNLLLIGGGLLVLIMLLSPGGKK